MHPLPGCYWCFTERECWGPVKDMLQGLPAALGPRLTHREEDTETKRSRRLQWESWGASSQSEAQCCAGGRQSPPSSDERLSGLGQLPGELRGPGWGGDALRAAPCSLPPPVSWEACEVFRSSDKPMPQWMVPGPQGAVEGAPTRPRAFPCSLTRSNRTDHREMLRGRDLLCDF